MTVIILFLFGLVFGSFLNVLIYRVPLRRSLRGRSHCVVCNKQIRATDLIPVLSYLLLRGKCRHCHGSISFRYPLIELISGVFFVVSFFLFIGDGLAVWLFCLFLIELFIVILCTDARDFLIPHPLVLTGLFASFAYGFFEFFVSSQKIFNIISFQHIATALLVFLILGSLWYISRGRWFGFGDITLLTLIAFIFGMTGFLVIWYLAVMTGAIFSIIMLALGKLNRKSPIPFGSFLSANAILVILTRGYFEHILVIIYRYLSA